jgi:hypothetical protein
VRGCNNKLDETGRPVEYCDWQQGRCPMQKRAVNKYEIWLILGMALCIAMLIAAIA